MNPEHLLLAWLFLKSSRSDEIFSRINPSQIGDAFIAEAFEAARKVSDKGQRPDPFSVSQQMDGDRFDDLMKFCDLPLSENLDAVIESVIDRGARKRLKTALELALRSVDEQDTFEDALNSSVSALEGIQDASQCDDTTKHVKATLGDYVKELERRSDNSGQLLGLSTGFEDLDEVLKGLRNGNMIVVAGRPSMGKSTFALNIATHNALKGKSVLVFSMEMGEIDLNDKFVSSISGAFLNLIQSGDITMDEHAGWMAKVSQAITDLQRSKLHLDTRGGLSMDQVRAACFKVKRKSGLDLVVIDYLGLMRAKGSRYEAVTELSNGVQRLSRDLQVPVIVLSQLSRGVEGRPDKRPTMSDLRESGAIEQDADVILFPYRDAYYHENSPYKSGDDIAEVIIAKNKMGERKSVYLKWQGNRSRFVDDDSGIDWKDYVEIKEKQPKRRGMF